MPSLVPYVLRHTFASKALAAGPGTFELARVIGTSLEMIERTYGDPGTRRGRRIPVASGRLCRKTR